MPRSAPRCFVLFLLGLLVLTVGACGEKTEPKRSLDELVALMAAGPEGEELEQAVQALAEIGRADPATHAPRFIKLLEGERADPSRNLVTVTMAYKGSDIPIEKRHEHVPALVGVLLRRLKAHRYPGDQIVADIRGYDPASGEGRFELRLPRNPLGPEVEGRWLAQLLDLLQRPGGWVLAPVVTAENATTHHGFSSADEFATFERQALENLKNAKDGERPDPVRPPFRAVISRPLAGGQPVPVIVREPARADAISETQMSVHLLASLSDTEGLLQLRPLATGDNARREAFAKTWNGQPMALLLGGAAEFVSPFTPAADGTWTLSVGNVDANQRTWLEGLLRMAQLPRVDVPVTAEIDRRAPLRDDSPWARVLAAMGREADKFLLEAEREGGPHVARIRWAREQIIRAQTGQ